MPVQNVTSTVDSLTVFRGRLNSITLLRSNYVADQATREIEATLDLQKWLDYSLARTDLPADDPEKDADPDSERIFWNGDDIVHRSVLVVSLSWPDESEPIVELKRVD